MGPGGAAVKTLCSDLWMPCQSKKLSSVGNTATDKMREFLMLRDSTPAASPSHSLHEQKSPGFLRKESPN